MQLALVGAIADLPEPVEEDGLAQVVAGSLCSTLGPTLSMPQYDMPSKSALRLGPWAGPGLDALAIGVVVVPANAEPRLVTVDCQVDAIAFVLPPVAVPIAKLEPV